MNQPPSSGNLDKIDNNHFTRRTWVAYFSMEIAIAPEMPTHSGGLGILAGDTARAAADLDLPIVFVTLISRAGYLRQELDPAGHQGDVPDRWDPQRWARPLPAMMAVPIGERAVWVRPWLHVLQCPTGGAAPIVLNAANEVAVASFLAGEIPFLEIARLVEDALGASKHDAPHSIGDVLEIDRVTRENSRAMMKASCP